MDAQSEERIEAATFSPWLNVREAAARARTSQKRIYRSVAAKELQAVRLGKKILFRAEWVDAFLERSLTIPG